MKSVLMIPKNWANPTHPEAALFGMGEDTRHFREKLHTQLTQAHSEYVEVLWTSGVPGFVMYLVLMAMLYRHHVEFAVGHGVSVHVEVSEESSDRAVM